MNCTQVLKWLEIELFDNNIEQYSFIPSYMAELKTWGREDKFYIADFEFMRLSINFWEGL